MWPLTALNNFKLNFRCRLIHVSLPRCFSQPTIDNGHALQRFLRKAFDLQNAFRLVQGFRCSVTAGKPVDFGRVASLGLNQSAQDWDSLKPRSHEGDEEEVFLRICFVFFVTSWLNKMSQCCLVRFSVV
jgi:hypothetical protein